MPVVVEDGITLTLHTGDTVTLYEKNISQDERKAIAKRSLLISSSIQHKTKQAEKLDEKRKAIEGDESLNGDREVQLAEVDEQDAELWASIDWVAIRAEVLSRRFESWDVFATNADKDAGKPVELSRDAIMTFCEKPKRAALIAEIMEKLAEHDKREEKNALSGLVAGGNSSTPIATSN